MKNANPNLSVLMAVPSYPYPVVGGLERQAHELSKALQESGVKVQVISTPVQGNIAGNSVVEGINVYRFNYQALGCFRYFLLPIKIFFNLFRLRKQFQVVHVHQHSVFGLLFVLSARILNKPVIIKLPNVGERGIPWLRKSRFGWLKVKVLKLADAIVAMSVESIAELEAINFPRERVLLTPNGISLIAPVKTAVPMSPDQIVNVVYVGRLTAQKGIENLLYAWQAVSRSEPSAVLRLWGDGELRAELEELVDYLQIRHCVDFCGHVDDVSAKLPDMDIFVLPSYTEGNSNAVLEAMRAGLPIVATKVGGTEMQIGSEGRDFLVTPRCPDEIADRLITLIKSASLRNKLGQAMLDRVRRFFDIYKVAATYRQAYVLLTEGKRDQLIELGNPVIRGVDELSDQPL